MNDETAKKPQTRSASVRIDPEVDQALESVREHISESLPGIRPNTSDVLRWALLDSAKRIQQTKLYDSPARAVGHGQSQQEAPSPNYARTAGFGDVA